MTHEESLAMALSYLTKEERAILLDGIRKKYNLPMDTEAYLYQDFDNPNELRVYIPKIDIEPNEEGLYFEEFPAFNKEQLEKIMPFINRYLNKEVSLSELSKILNNGDNEEDTPDVSIRSRKQRYIIAILVVLYKQLAGESVSERFKERVQKRFKINPESFATEISKISTAMGDTYKTRRKGYSNPVKESVLEQMRELEAALGLNDGQ